MTVETLALIGSVAAGVVAAIASIAAAYYGRKSYKASKDQLALSREQASRVPALALASVELLPLHADAELAKEVTDTREHSREAQRKRREKERQAEQARLERQRREEEQRREREEREERQRRNEADRGPLNRPNFDPTLRVSSLADLARNITPRTQQYNLLQFQTPSEPYEGPFPDAYIEAKIKNVGKSVAYEVTAWMTLEKSALEPVEYFTEKGVDVISEVHSTVTLELRAQRDSGRLLPSENDWHLFLIPVLRHRTEGSVTTRYEITSPQGGVDAKGEVELPLDFSKRPTGEHE